jgi:hypothetical protein
MTPTIDHLHRKTRKLAEDTLDADEEIVAVIPGRSKHAMIVTHRRIVMLKPGVMSGAWLGPKVASFRLTEITGINVHSGPRMGALELVIAGRPQTAKPDMSTAFQSPTWLPCHPAVSGSPAIAELRAFAETDGRSRSARAELGAFDGQIPH